MAKEKKTPEVRILLADDHAVVRTGLSALLEDEPGWKICGEAATGREAIARTVELKPDVAIIDVNMPDLNGLEAAREIKRLVPQTELIIFTTDENDALIRDVFAVGARSYVLKSQAMEHLVSAVRAAAAHKPFFTSQVGEVLFARFIHGKTGAEAEKSDERLTKREREIVQLIAEGASNKEVAQKLGLSLRTAETHRANILRKLSLGSVAELVRYAIRNKIIQA